MAHDILFTPLRLGAIELPHRVIMAPLTRMRSGVGGTPTPLNVEYYAQRATAGLIFTEDTTISRQAQGYPSVPGIFTPTQILGWRAVTDAVHADGGRIVMQIAHNGRNSHSSFMPDGELPIAPSAIPPTGQAHKPNFEPVDYETPRALETKELPEIVVAFREAALNAMDAGFDGVSVQGGNGQLLEQFLEDGTNRRTDAYGGGIENRARLLLDVVDAVSGAIGAERLGVRLSPYGQFGGISDSDPLSLFTYVITELSKRRIAYLHLIEALGSEIGLSDDLHVGAVNNATLFRSFFDGPLISAAAYTPESAAATIEAGHADAIAFGRLFIANPDLPERIQRNAPLNSPNRATFYGGGAEGYTDYPSLP
ncbi:MAG: NADH:flavin oxidoreductase [Capsulimonas sp.]|nr:NADH:flavin oxidoreductase [Capsulimonas sp.]